MPENLKRIALYCVGGLGWLMAIGSMGFGIDVVDMDTVTAFLGHVAGNQITQAGFFFTIAAWLHSGRVKKEIKANFEGLTSAINNVGDSLREDLKNHSDRLDKLDSRVQYVENNLKQVKGA